MPTGCLSKRQALSSKHSRGRRWIGASSEGQHSEKDCRLERKKGYEEQLKHEQEEAQQVRRHMEKEKDELIDRHEREATIWMEIKGQYEEASALYK